MNYSVIGILCALLPGYLFSMHNMHKLGLCAKGLSAQRVAKRSMQNGCNTQAYNNSAAALRACIKDPEFSLFDVADVIQEDLPSLIKPNPCRANGILQHVVDCAVTDAKNEDRYAEVIRQLHAHGWVVDFSCCKSAMLQKAVQHNLVEVVEALADTAGWQVTAVDSKGRTPAHYLQSPDMADYLLAELSLCVDAVDKDGNTPLHLVPASVVPVLLKKHARIDIQNKIHFLGLYNQTPLRKAVVEMDTLKCDALLKFSASVQSRAEHELLCNYARLKLYETKDAPHHIENKNYRAILGLLERYKSL